MNRDQGYIEITTLKLPEGLDDCIDAVNKYIRFDREHRGNFLLEITWLESAIDKTIIYTFSNQEDFAIFNSIVLKETNLNLYSKILILKKIIKYKYPELLEEYPKLFNELNKVREFRNL